MIARNRYLGLGSLNKKRYAAVKIKSNALIVIIIFYLI